MPGKAPRQKGDAYEREVKAKLNEAGLNCKKIPSSGAGADFKGDLIVDDFRGEAKIRKRGFQTIYDWIEEGNDFVVCRQNRSYSLVTITLDTFIELMQARRGD